MRTHRCMARDQMRSARCAQVIRRQPVRLDGLTAVRSSAATRACPCSALVSPWPSAVIGVGSRRPRTAVIEPSSQRQPTPMSVGGRGHHRRHGRTPVGATDSP